MLKHINNLNLKSNQPFPKDPWSVYNTRTFSPGQPEKSSNENKNSKQVRGEAQAQKREKDTNGRRTEKTKTSDLTILRPRMTNKTPASQYDSTVSERGSDSCTGDSVRQQLRYSGCQTGMAGKTCKSLAGRDKVAEAVIGVGAWADDSGSGESGENA